jgi:hypothetical protein
MVLLSRVGRHSWNFYKVSKTKVCKTNGKMFIWNWTIFNRHNTDYKFLGFKTINTTHT